MERYAAYIKPVKKELRKREEKRIRQEIRRSVLRKWRDRLTVPTKRNGLTH